MICSQFDNLVMDMEGLNNVEMNKYHNRWTDRSIDYAESWNSCGKNRATWRMTEVSLWNIIDFLWLSKKLCKRQFSNNKIDKILKR